jgi:hypothetical protein
MIWYWTLEGVMIMTLDLGPNNAHGRTQKIRNNQPKHLSSPRSLKT